MPKSLQNYRSCLCRMYRWVCGQKISNPIHRSEKSKNKESSAYPKTKPQGSVSHVYLSICYHIRAEGQNRLIITTCQRKPRKKKSCLECQPLVPVLSRYKSKSSLSFPCPSELDGANGNCGSKIEGRLLFVGTSGGSWDATKGSEREFGMEEIPSQLKTERSVNSLAWDGFTVGFRHTWLCWETRVMGW